LFNEKNVKEFAPLIKIYATQKLSNPNLNYTSFYGLMDDYITESDNYINNVLNVMLPAVRKQLPNIFITGDDAANRAPLEAGFTEQTRTELWETFKALNDSWIAGFDFESNDLFPTAFGSMLVTGMVKAQKETQYKPEVVIEDYAEDKPEVKRGRKPKDNI
jgi:hypothetical protein